MWFPVAPADVGFADASKRHFTYDFHVQAAPRDVFEWISDPDAFARWFPDYRGARWLTAAPHRAGSVREVRLRGLGVRERVLVWEPGKRFAFSITKITRPLLARMVEDYRLSPVARDGGTRVQWTIAYQPRLALRPLEPLLKPIFSRLFARACDHLRRYGEEQTSE